MDTIRKNVKNLFLRRDDTLSTEKGVNPNPEAVDFLRNLFLDVRKHDSAYILSSTLSNHSIIAEVPRCSEDPQTLGKPLL